MEYYTGFSLYSNRLFHHNQYRTDLASTPWHSPGNVLVSGLRTDLPLVWGCIDRHGTWGVSVPWRCTEFHSSANPGNCCEAFSISGTAFPNYLSCASADHHSHNCSSNRYKGAVNDCQTPAGLVDEKPFLCPLAVARIMKYTNPGPLQAPIAAGSPRKTSGFS